MNRTVLPFFVAPAVARCCDQPKLTPNVSSLGETHSI